MKRIIIMATITMAAFAQAQFTLKELVDAYNAETNVPATGEVIEVEDNRQSEIQKTANAIARTLWAEARSEGELGICLVASVIYNRAGGDPAKMHEVVTKPKQFTCWNSGEPKVEIRTPEDIKAWDACVEASWDLVCKRFIPVTTATHFEKVGGKTPWWAKRMQLVRTYRKHNFYKE